MHVSSEEAVPADLAVPLFATMSADLWTLGVKTATVTPMLACAALDAEELYFPRAVVEVMPPACWRSRTSAARGYAKTSAVAARPRRRPPSPAATSPAPAAAARSTSGAAGSDPYALRRRTARLWAGGLCRPGRTGRLALPPRLAHEPKPTLRLPSRLTREPPSQPRTASTARPRAQGQPRPALPPHPRATQPARHRLHGSSARPNPASTCLSGSSATRRGSPDPPERLINHR